MSYFMGSNTYRASQPDYSRPHLRDGLTWARTIKASAYEAAILEQLAQVEVLDPSGDPRLAAVLAERARSLARHTRLSFIQHQADLHLARAGLLGADLGTGPYVHLHRALNAAHQSGVVPNQWFALNTALHLLARDGHGVHAALIDANRSLDPFGRGQTRRLFGELYVDRIDDAHRQEAAVVYPAITDTSQLTAVILEALGPLVTVDV